MTTDRKRRCFVISPIGAEGSAVRQHADDVFDFVIKPALDECGIDAFRSDHLRDPGKITDQMFRAILGDDLCVAVLTGNNPNVFYELAIAQAAARPTIILVEKGHPLPFDVQDVRCVQYDLGLRSYQARTHINEVVAHVGRIAAAGWVAPPPFGVEPPLGGRHRADEPRFFPQASDRGGARTWIENVRDAAEFIDVLGMSLGFLRSGKGISDTLVAKAQAGCRVRVLFLDRQSPTLPHLVRDSELQRRYEPKLKDIENSEVHFAQLAKHSPNIAVRRMRIGCPFVAATRTEHLAVCVQHFFSEKLRYCPLWECPRGSRLYELLAQEYEALWQANADTPATE